MIIREVINGALRKLGVYASGESASANEAQDALTQINRMLSAWSVQSGNLYTYSADSYTLSTGTGGYSFGSGGDIDSPRPSRILECYVTNGCDNILVDLSRQAYVNIFDKSIQGEPTSFLYTLTYPLAAITLYPVPDAAYTLTITSHKPLIQYVTISDDFGLPLEYAEAMEYNLAMRLLPEYPGTSSSNTTLIYQAAATTLQDLKRYNMSLNVPQPNTDITNSNIKGYSINTDAFR